MNKSVNFWQDLKKPILCLAPMADVTDSAFRFIISKYSKKVSKGVFEMPRSQKTPFDTFVTYTEFVSADGLVLALEKGKKKLLKDLEFSEIERPIVAQIFGSNPENIEKAARLIAELGPAQYHPSIARIGSGFDGIDINMGCPDKNIQKQNAGAALIKNPKLAREIIAAAKRGVEDKIPVSVKTRLGYSKDELETWLPELLAENPAAIIIHARTKKEMSKVPARWERVKRAVEIRDEIQNFSTQQSQKCTDIFLLENSSCSAQSASQGISETVVPKNFERTLIIGNGDVKDIKDAIQKCEETSADGAMIGRGIFGNPWLFADYEPTTEERLGVLLEHTKLFEEKFKDIKSFDIMKKHFREYLKGPELRDLRFKLMRTENAEEVEKLISDFWRPI